MHRNSTRDISFRAYVSITRATLNEADDDHNMQELSADGMHGDSRKGIERVQNYGFTSVPVKRDGGEQKKQEGDEGVGKKGPAAEAVMLAGGGNRAHPVIIAVDDRRHRPYGLKPGENAQYDDQAQMMYLARDGAYVLSNKTNASLRHVNKEPQKRKKGTSQAQAQQSGQQEQEYDHKGEVNTEVLCTKDSVFVKVGSTILVEVVKATQKVYLGGKKDDPMAKVMTEDGPSTNVYARVG